MTSTDLSTFTHEFHVADCEFWAYRHPGEWLEDLFDSRVLGISEKLIDARNQMAAHPDESVRARANIGLASIGRGDDFYRVTVHGPEWLLRFVCVAFNQHAEQSPGDPTPTFEALRLEETLNPPDQDYTFMVTVTTDSLGHAAEALANRLGPDEEYGFDYRVRWRHRDEVRRPPETSEVFDVTTMEQALPDPRGAQGHLPLVVWDEFAEAWRVICGVRSDSDSPWDPNAIVLELGAEFDTRFHS